MLNNNIKSEIKEYALANRGSEICGLLIKNKDDINFYKCRNISYYKEYNCILNPFDYIKASKVGKIIGHVHSQEDRYPSFIDYLNAISHNIYSIIYSWKYDKFSIIEPKLKTYLNLEYKLGKNDCFELVKNYYKNELDITIPEHKRYDKWELDNPNLIINNIEGDGFHKVNFEDIKKNDIIIFNIYDIPCHLAIYLGSGLILHHPENDRSVLCELSKGLLKRINAVIRHKDL